MTRLPRRSASEQVRPRSQSSDNEDLKKLRKARGAHVVIDGNSIDFPSSPVMSPEGSPAKHVSAPLIYKPKPPSVSRALYKRIHTMSK